MTTRVLFCFFGADLLGCRQYFTFIRGSSIGNRRRSRARVLIYTQAFGQRGHGHRIRRDLFAASCDGMDRLGEFSSRCIFGRLDRNCALCGFESKWRMYLIAVLLAMSVKEDVVLILFPLGIWVAWRRQIKFGLFTALISFGTRWWQFLEFSVESTVCL